MFNNKGQSLILFVIVLPIILGVLVLVIDVCKILVLRQELNNISEIVLDYGLVKLDDNINDDLEDELIQIVNLNKKDIDLVNINIVDNKIYVMLSEREEGIFSSFLDISIFNVKSYNVGYFVGTEKRIEKVRGD